MYHVNLIIYHWSKLGERYNRMVYHLCNYSKLKSSLKNHMQEHKHVNIPLIKFLQGFCESNYKALLKAIKENINTEKHHVHRLENIVKNCFLFFFFKLI